MKASSETETGREPMHSGNTDFGKIYVRTFCYLLIDFLTLFLLGLNLFIMFDSSPAFSWRKRFFEIEPLSSRYHMSMPV